MPETSEDFKQRLAAVLVDLRQEGINDGEAMFLIGRVATRLCEKTGQPTWTAFRQHISRNDYDTLMREFQRDGNEAYSQGKGKIVYALQALSVSLAAKVQTDPETQQGAKLLDGLIDRIVANYKRQMQNKPAS
ncbi:MAG TPA: hypothetical protein VGM83_19190 [Devosiaceae bacterium]